MANKIVYRPLRDFATIKQLMQESVANAPDKIAFMYKKNGEVVQVTYSEFWEETKALGTALSHRGLTDGHLACAGENSYKWLVTFLTVLQSKGVYIPIDAELPQKDVEHILEEGDATVCFCSKKFEARFKEGENQLPNIKYFICFDEAEHDGRYLSFDRLVRFKEAVFRNKDVAGIDIVVNEPNRPVHHGGIRAAGMKARYAAEYRAVRRTAERAGQAVRRQIGGKPVG